MRCSLACAFKGSKTKVLLCFKRSAKENYYSSGEALSFKKDIHSGKACERCLITISTFKEHHEEKN
jgi:hypothetical protein